MLVILFRHGPSEERDPERWPDDGDRPLTERGEEKTRRAAEGLSRLVPSVDVVLASPLIRAQQTARILCDVLQAPAAETIAALEPGSPWRAVLERLRREPEDATIVLVGHEPDLGRLAGGLVFGAPRAMPLKKSGACAVYFELEVEPGRGELEWFATPRMLRKVGRQGAKV
jgi:phosphohistidine phosphatase